jgi:hypothetical protein
MESSSSAFSSLEVTPIDHLLNGEKMVFFLD